MTRTLGFLCTVSVLAGCSTLGSTGSKPSAPTSTASSGGGGKATAAATKLDEHAFYTISTVIDGQALALTFIPPHGPDIRTVNNNAGKSRVELRKLTGEPGQLWNPHPEGEHYLIYAKIKDAEQENGGVLIVYNVDKRLDDAAHADDDKYNRLTVGSHSNETREYWALEPVADGTFVIKNQVGLSEHPGEEDWDAPRALEAVSNGHGDFKARNMAVRDASTQHWTFTKHAAN